MNGISSPIHVGIIGCGGISRAHALAYNRLHDLFKVDIVCDLNQDAASARSTQLGGCNITSDWQRVIEDPRIDAVDIILPHNLHHPVGVAALKAGKHVCMEKPLAITMAEGYDLVHHAGAAGTVFMVAFNERHRWSVKAIKGIVDSGRIGDLYMVRTDHNQNPEFAKDAWYRKRESAGGGAVIGSGIHMLDLLHWFCGDATLVSASTITLPERLDAETAASVTVEFEPATHQKTGCIGTLDISWAAPHHPWYQFLVVYGTKGTVSTLRGDVINICDDAGVEVLKAPEGDVWTDSFCDELRYWGECIVGSSRPMTHAGDALKSLEICLAAYRAAETHTSVRLPLAH